jgi:hypothetical protein
MVHSTISRNSFVLVNIPFHMESKPPEPLSNKKREPPGKNMFA